MNKKIKKLSILLGLLALMISVTGVNTASAALTFGALTAASDGAITITGAVGSAVNLGTTATTGAITIGGSSQTGAITLG